jgi:hypothetical protein
MNDALHMMGAAQARGTSTWPGRRIITGRHPNLSADGELKSTTIVNFDGVEAVTTGSTRRRE